MKSRFRWFVLLVVMAIAAAWLAASPPQRAAAGTGGEHELPLSLPVESDGKPPFSNCPACAPMAMKAVIYDLKPRHPVRTCFQR